MPDAAPGRSTNPQPLRATPLRYARRRSVRRLSLQTGIKQKRRVFSGAGHPPAGQLYLSLGSALVAGVCRPKRSGRDLPAPARKVIAAHIEKTLPGILTIGRKLRMYSKSSLHNAEHDEAIGDPRQVTEPNRELAPDNRVHLTAHGSLAMAFLT
jgi:hypothetical protein